jgi:hypothetical protein
MHLRRTTPLIPAEETGLSTPGAEGATAPETLRPKDRGEMALWKAAMLQGIAHRRA